jgi:hypothetical protein
MFPDCLSHFVPLPFAPGSGTGQLRAWIPAAGLDPGLRKVGVERNGSDSPQTSFYNGCWTGSGLVPGQLDLSGLVMDWLS